MVTATPVHAVSYGKNSYGKCSYVGCKTAATSSTTATTPSGLKISTNLTNGQAIPLTGYTIIVTPLNGQGITFRQVTFYINGAMAATVQPDETGTARWFWDPRTLPGTQVTVVITDKDGSVITQEFRVTMGTAAAATAQSNPEQQHTILQRAYDSAQSVVRALPTPVIYSVPYLLFILLGINVLLLVLQTRRELQAYQTLQALLARDRAVAAAKKDLVQLASHYLRTPLTIIQGGLGLLQKTVASPTLAALQQATQHMHQTVESLVAQTAKGTDQTVTALHTPRLWQQPALLLPLALIGSIALPFNYLAAHAKSLSVNQVNIATQAIIFVILALTTYQVVRRLQLRQRDRRQLQQAARAEAATAHARDILITNVTKTLRTDLANIETAASQLDVSPATTFIAEGQQRLQRVLDKFATAQTLRGGHSNRPFERVQLSILAGQAMRQLKPKANAKQVILQPVTEVLFASQEPALLGMVITSLLDNAIAYSASGGVIELAARTTPTSTTITISDHGVGIPAEKAVQLFQPFVKAEGAETFTHEGMGFSLYLDKLIMAYLGGSINLLSQPGKGTTVTLQLPASN